ncbi:MAG: hypothetical protein IJB52_04820 [Clostridia bacterium]|nr:hypothetical protein [Clostridia bacterium]
MKNCCFLYGLFLIFMLILPVSAETYIYDGAAANTLDTAWTSFLESLPETIRRETSDLHPNSPESWQQYLSLSYWTDKLSSILHDVFQNALINLVSLFGIILCIAAIQQWTETTAGSLFGFCSDVCMALTVFQTAGTLFFMLQQFLEQLCQVMTGMIPVMTAVCYSSGEITTASVNRISMTMFVTVLNTLQRWLFMPLGQALFSLGILTAVCTQVQLGGFVAGVKKLFMTMLSFMLLVYSFVYGIQNTLAKSADSLGLRTIKFAMGNFIPVVGGTVSDAFSAVREGLGYIRVMTGAGGIIILVLMLLPVAVSVWVFDLVLTCSHTTAELLGCTQSARMLADTRSVLQLMSALVWLAATFFLFAVILFTKTAVHTG